MSCKMRMALMSRTPIQPIRSKNVLKSRLCWKECHEQNLVSSHNLYWMLVNRSENKLFLLQLRILICKSTGFQDPTRMSMMYIRSSRLMPLFLHLALGLFKIDPAADASSGLRRRGEWRSFLRKAICSKKNISSPPFVYMAEYERWGASLGGFAPFWRSVTSFSGFYLMCHLKSSSGIHLGWKQKIKNHESNQNLLNQQSGIFYDTIIDHWTLQDIY